MFKVVITDYIGPEVEPEKALIGDLAEIVCLRARSVAELERRVEDADAIIIFHEVTLPGEVIDRLENCRVIARGGVGYDAWTFAGPASAASRSATCRTMEWMRSRIRRSA